VRQRFSIGAQPKPSLPGRVRLVSATGKPRAREVALSDDQNFAGEFELAWDGMGWLTVFELWRNLRKQIHWGHAFCD
jgi:hypothetical protein